jgi:hypothetical protein
LCASLTQCRPAARGCGPSSRSMLMRRFESCRPSQTPALPTVCSLSSSLIMLGPGASPPRQSPSSCCARFRSISNAHVPPPVRSNARLELAERLRRRDGQSGSIELKPLPTTYRHLSPIGELRYRQEGAQHLISRPAIVLYVRYPTSSDTGKQPACRRAAQKTQTYRSLRFHAVAALVPSAGTITLQIELR